MKRREVTDEMLTRAVKAAWGDQLFKAPRLQTDAPRGQMRAALEAALNPPPPVQSSRFHRRHDDHVITAIVSFEHRRKDDK